MTVNGIAGMGVLVTAIWLAIPEIAGIPTPNMKVVELMLTPSETYKVIVVCPCALPAGVIVTVRFVSLPLKTILLVGTRPVLEEPLQTVRLLAGVSASCTVNAMGPAAVLAGVVWLAIAEMSGAVFAPATSLNDVPILRLST